MLLWENTRKEVREALESGRLKAAIVPTGSTEQHNEHMALGTDFAMATFLSQRVALELYPQAIVSTPCPVGYAPYHMARKGTLTLRRETFKAFVYDVIESLKAHGFNTVLVLNGHGGNYAPLKEAIPEWRESLGITLDMEMPSPAYTEADLVRLIQSYRDANAGLLNDVQESAMSHASEVETSRVLAAFPHRVRPITMEEYDEAGLDYESGLPPEVLRYYAQHFGEGPKGHSGREQPSRPSPTGAVLACDGRNGRGANRAFDRFHSDEVAEDDRRDRAWPAMATVVGWSASSSGHYPAWTWRPLCRFAIAHQGVAPLPPETAC